MTAIGVGWGITWLTWSSDYTRFIKPGISDKKVFWTTCVGDLHPDRVARLPRRDDRERRRVERSGGLRDRGVRRVLDPGALPRHARAGRDEHPQPLLGDARGALARPEGSRAGRSASSCRSSAPACSSGSSSRGAGRTASTSGSRRSSLWISAWAGVMVVDYLVVPPRQDRRRRRSTRRRRRRSTATSTGRP